MNALVAQRTMREKLTVVALSVAAMFCLATTDAPSKAQGIARAVPPADVSSVSSGITVNGHSETHVKADVAYVTLSVQTSDRDQAKAVQDNAAKTQSVMEMLLKSSIAQKDIQTQYYTVQPAYADNTTPPVVTGYSVMNSLQVTIHDMSKAGLILDKATRAGATSADGLSFDLADRTKSQGEALVAAVADARAKANLVAGAAGVSVGRVLAISEQGASPSPVFPQIRMGAMDAATPTPISPQDVVITADVTATFSIDYSAR